jgi:hypothetical protein
VKIRYGHAHCPNCETRYDMDDGHLCPSARLAAVVLPAVVAGPATVPAPDRAHPPGLTWFAPLEARPIVLGPAADRPELHPALALDVARFRAGSRRGRHDWPAVHALENAAAQAAFTTDPYHRRRLLTAARALEMA